MFLWRLPVWLAPPVAIFILLQSPFLCFNVWSSGESVCMTDYQGRWRLLHISISSLGPTDHLSWSEPWRALCLWRQRLCQLWESQRCFDLTKRLFFWIGMQRQYTKCYLFSYHAESAGASDMGQGGGGKTERSGKRPLSCWLYLVCPSQRFYR